MEIVSIEKKTFEEMKERFGCFSQHVRELCARYRPPEKMNWMRSEEHTSEPSHMPKSRMPSSA